MDPMTKDRVLRRFLYEEVKKLNLVDFIQTHAGVTLATSGNSICPMPNHKDSDPSFSISQKQDSNGTVWLYNCFGCGSGGTIIDFCMDFFSFDSSLEALVFVLQKMGIASNQEMVSKAMQEAKVGMDLNKELECAHFVASRNCRRLLKGQWGDKRVETWVAKAYREMNLLLDKGDRNGVDMVGEEAMLKLVGGWG